MHLFIIDTDIAAVFTLNILQGQVSQVIHGIDRQFQRFNLVNTHLESQMQMDGIFLNPQLHILNPRHQGVFGRRGAAAGKIIPSQTGKQTVETNQLAHLQETGCDKFKYFITLLVAINSVHHFKLFQVAHDNPASFFAFVTLQKLRRPLHKSFPVIQSRQGITFQGIAQGRIFPEADNIPCPL